MSEFYYKLVQCKVCFDFSDIFLYWVFGEVEVFQVMNVLYMFLFFGELWFCCFYNKVLLLVSDVCLCDDVQGFICQEVMYLWVYDGVIQCYLSRFDIDFKLFIDKMDFFFECLFCDYLLGQNCLICVFDGWWLCQCCVIIVVVEYFICVFGKWVLEVWELDCCGSDLVMFDLLCWYGVEEVEYCSVVYDLYVYLGGSFVIW